MEQSTTILLPLRKIYCFKYINLIFKILIRNTTTVDIPIFLILEDFLKGKLLLGLPL